MGPFRINFSKSGIGLSAGIPGFRIGTGPRGNYVQMGAQGIYYRAALPRATGLPQHKSASHPPPQPIDHAGTSPIVPEGTLGEYRTIESAHAETLVDSSSEQLLEEIRKKHKQVRSWPFAAIATVLYCALVIAYGLPTWTLISGALVGLATVGFAYRWDVIRKLVVLHYELADQSATNYTAFVDSAAPLAKVGKLWHISATAHIKDRKYHAGASNAVKRQKATVTAAQPPYVASNLDPVTIALSNAVFYFFPDRLLVYNGTHVGAVSYSDLKSHASVARFIEEDAVPSDSKVVDRTWRYVNKKGDPDKRFKNNRQLPICAYGEIELKSESGVNELLMISRQGLEASFVDAIRHLSSQS
jgi:hypothetical protein